MRHRRCALSLGACLAVAGLLAGCGPGQATPSPTSPTPPPTAVASMPPASAPASAPAETDDPGDEPLVSETPAIGFTPGPTGLPVPTVSAEPMARLPGEPDPLLTPGSLNPNVTQANIATTICSSGWTATIRPPTSYTNALKVTQIAQYGYSDTSPASYEEDHLISLELGGNPTDPRNLWPEPYTSFLTDGRKDGAHVKDAFETKLKNQVCAGTITLAAAQAEIGDHWAHFDFQIP